jgi:alpha-tubulin suppressor-like RCC1 family protein
MGTHVFFITSENRVFAQGSNYYGQLGLGSGAPTQVATPTLVTFNGLIGGEFIDRFSVGGTFTVAITNLNRIYVMGENRGNQLGDGSATGRNIPTTISTEFLNGENISYIKSGQDHTFLITANGKIYAWGLNAIGTGATYGDGTTTNVTEPTEMIFTFLNAGETISELEVGSQHNYVRTSSGRYFAWGFGGEGRLVNGSSTASSIPLAFTTPTLQAGETIVNIISSPGPVTFMLTSLNRTLAFGRGADGQIGDGDPNSATATSVKYSPIFI